MKSRHGGPRPNSGGPRKGTAMNADRFRLLLEEINAYLVANIRTDYSGSGMYGQTCMALVVAREGILIRLVTDLMCAMQPGDEREAVRKVLARTEVERREHCLVAYWPELRT